MFEKTTIRKNNFYNDLIMQLEPLLEDAPTQISQLANTSALLNVYLENINWVGFYLFDGSQLILGPFQGLPACTQIAMGKGVCGTSAIKQEVIRVEDVHLFPGHIACDGASQSEIVLPIIINNQLFGVLDIDSPIKSRFSIDDEIGLKKVVDIIQRYIKQ